MSSLSGLRIHITGIVQGVGFRPFVYGLAKRLALAGWVRNTAAGVDIEVDGEAEALSSFLLALREEAPPLSHIDSIHSEYRAPNGFTAFEIVHSEGEPGDFIPVSPDTCVCEDCLQEMRDPDNRRYRYPFINCTNCGPRFTIIKDIPYDRPKTTMADFPMCEACEKEYEDPLNRRFHAQPVACPACGPQVWLEASDAGVGESEFSIRQLDEVGSENRLIGADAIRAVRQMLINGRILGIKGLGGFHLACDATQAQAVAELRRRKLRVDKAFALMMPDIETIEHFCLLEEEERQLLESRARPIVILKRRPGSTIAPQVAPNQDTLGVMLPYTPLHYLLFEDNRKLGSQILSALVMTSGNLSEEPIATDNEEARRRLAPLADAFLMHDRDIQTRCDDSVFRVVKLKSKGEAYFEDRKSNRPKASPGSESSEEQVYPLRRSRGYAPDPIRLIWDMPPVLATGAELKNTFCLTRDAYAFLSHHIGDLENYETLCAFQEGIRHYERLFRIKPEVIAHDLHPDYLATRYALERAGSEGVPLIGVQHHFAHIASCMAENDHPGDRQVIGVSFDGTGFGEDGAIWGGEFLLVDYYGFQRVYHLDYVPLPGGDKAIREPWRVALSWLQHSGIDWSEDLLPVQHLLRENTAQIGILQQQISAGINAPLTSSAGRLFDAVSALIGVRQVVNYEAQAAIELEMVVDPDEPGYYAFDLIHPDDLPAGQRSSTVDLSPAFDELVGDLRRQETIPIMAARFHNTISRMVLEVCQQIRAYYGVHEVALSGGVWQNMILLARSYELLSEDGFSILLHHQVPANDGGLSLGQAVIAAHQLRSETCV